MLWALAASAALNLAALRLGPSASRDPLGVRLSADNAVESASLMSFGMRRLAADLGLIRLLVYYGTPEPDSREAHEGEPGHHHEPFDSDHPERSWGGGFYPELGPRARRLLDIDPKFSYPALFSAGALAFNLNRPQEALGLLEYGLKRDPGNFQFHAYIAAIGFHKRGDIAQSVRLLEPVLGQPDCPTMIKSMVAFLYKKSGQREKAIRLYREIIETTRDVGYRETAERMLKEIE
ncbi:MAG: hypothetical protein HY921_00635 [Elusimicrobia bacterium]|nr:hypothetical protein [Elusimicrobiota bacterium]